MRLLQAIAYSPGNKAEGMNDQGHRVLVQERYASIADHWYHVWHLHQEQVTQTDINEDDLARLGSFEVDPEADYWFPVG
jgi:hypothetical protein